MSSHKKSFLGKIKTKFTGAEHKRLEIPAYAQTWLEVPGKAVWSNRNYRQFADEAFRRNVIANRAISMIAEAAASINIKLFYQTNRSRQEVKKHPLLSLLAKPTPIHNLEDFSESIYSYRLISGNSYILAIGSEINSPLELHVLRPDRVTIIAGRKGMPAAYRYQVGDKYTDYAVDEISGRSKILHFKTFNPLDDWYGLSPVEAAAYSIDQHNQAAAWNQALLQNGARPSGALVVKSEGSYQGNLSEDKYSRLKIQIDEQFSGAANAGRPILLEGGLEWKEMSINPRDMDFLNTKHSSARDIALAFGIPPQLLGIPGDNTYSNYSEARVAFWEETVIPLASSFINALNGWLVPMFDENLTLTLDLENLSALSPRRDAMWARIKDTTFISDEEKRKILGL